MKIIIGQNSKNYCHLYSETYQHLEPNQPSFFDLFCTIVRCLIKWDLNLVNWHLPFEHVVKPYQQEIGNHLLTWSFWGVLKEHRPLIYSILGKGRREVPNMLSIFGWMYLHGWPSPAFFWPLAKKLKSKKLKNSNSKMIFFGKIRPKLP